MKDILETLDELIVEARKLEPSPYVGNLISALNAAKDNATWEAERRASTPSPLNGEKAGMRGEEAKSEGSPETAPAT